MSLKELESDITEREMAAAGKTAPRVSREHILALSKRIVVKCHVVEGTTTTIAVALLDGQFMLAQEFSACVDPANFIPETGERIATGKAMDAAVNKLWEVCGFRLWALANDIPLGAVEG